MAEKEGELILYQADLAAVCTDNHQFAHVSSPDYSDHIRALSSSLLPLKPDTLFYFLVNLHHVYEAPLWVLCRL